MSIIPKPFSPTSPLLEVSPYKQGTAIPDPYSYKNQDHALPISFQPNIVGSIENPYETAEAYGKRTGAQMLTLVNQHSKQAIARKENKECTSLGDKFFEINNCVFCLENDQKTILSNFTVRVLSRIQHKNIGDSTDIITVRVTSSVTETILEIPLTKYKNLLGEIKTDHPEFRLNADFRNASSFFAEYCSLVYEEALATMTRPTVYAYAGWEKIDNRMIYLSGRLPICQSERYVWEVHSQDIAAIYQQGQAFLAVGNDLKTILPLFLYAHIGYTAQLFEEAGYEVQFLMMLIGKTGSFKTSLCRELFQAFNTDKFLNFQSTPRAIELQRNECRDMTLLLDDIFSCKDKDTLKKFEDVLRVFGDNAAKAKANAASTKIDRFTVRGSAVVTGESDLNTQQSSRLRYLTITVDNSSFKPEVLRYYQNDRSIAKQQDRPSIIQQYFSAYIYYLENNYSDIVRDIMQIDSHLVPLPVKFPRLNMIYRIMFAISRIVINFGLTYGALTTDIAENILSIWTAIIRTIILENQNDSSICEPYIAYLDALIQGIAVGDVVLADDKETFFLNGKDYFGFHDSKNEKIYLNYQKCFKYVEKYYTDMKGKFESTYNDIHKSLYENGLSEGYQEKTRNRHLKKVASSGQTFQMLCLKCAAVEATLSENKN